MDEDLNRPADMRLPEKAARLCVHVLSLVLVTVGTISTAFGVLCVIVLFFNDDAFARGFSVMLAPPLLLFGVIFLGEGIMLDRTLKQTAPQDAKRATNDSRPK